MNLKLTSKVILVAASSKGLGYGIASSVAKEGGRVSLASRGETEIKNAAQQIREEYQADARGYAVDVTNPDAINAWVTSTLKDFGTIDGLVVNAGGPPAGTFDTFDDAQWQKAFELTLLSSVRMIRAVLPTLKEKKSGSILTITSTSIKEPIDELLLSNVFRSGVVSLVKSLSRELAEQGIRINNLVPGRINTDRVTELDEKGAQRLNISLAEKRAREQGAIPMARYGTVDEFANAATFLLSDAASYITGTTLIVDGGKTKTVW